MGIVFGCIRNLFAAETKRTLAIRPNNETKDKPKKIYRDPRKFTILQITEMLSANDLYDESEKYILKIALYKKIKALKKSSSLEKTTAGMFLKKKELKLKVNKASTIKYLHEPLIKSRFYYLNCQGIKDTLN